MQSPCTRLLMHTHTVYQHTHIYMCIHTHLHAHTQCSYNSINGVPSCASSHLMTDLARKQWGFKGYIVSDCGATDYVQTQHHFTQNASATIEATFGAGMDLYNCHGGEGGPGVVSRDAMLAFAATDDGARVINTALAHLFDVQIRLGLLDPPHLNPWSNLSDADIDTPQHRAVAEEAALQSFTLLKNVNATLPLRLGLLGEQARRHSVAGRAREDGRGKMTKPVPHIALVGPHGNATTALLGNYAARAPFIISPLAGLQQYCDGGSGDEGRGGGDVSPLCRVSFARGCSVGGSSDSKADFEAAVALASQADVDAVVVFAGLDITQEGEGRDRSTLGWPGKQQQLIQAVASAAHSGNKPVVLVLVSGGGIDVSEERDSGDIGAILWAGYPGQAGGAALARTLLDSSGSEQKHNASDITPAGATSRRGQGQPAYSPAGRLPTTWYLRSYADAVSPRDMRMRPHPPLPPSPGAPPSASPGRGFRFFNGSVAYKFGAGGQGYTTFQERIGTVLVHGRDARAEVMGHQSHQQHYRGHEGGHEVRVTVPVSRVEEGLRRWSHAPHLASKLVSVEVNATNIGNVASDRVVLLFASPPALPPSASTRDRSAQPLKMLMGFQRVHALPGQSALVRFEVSAMHLSLVNENGTRQPAPGDSEEWRFFLG